MLIGFVSYLLADERVQALSDEERVWLLEEVVYIISPGEREVYLDLQTQTERTRFVAAFWKRRDPNPSTLENEFEKEHYRRLEYASRVLGRESPRAGWRTDRGKYYIILGEPKEIQRYDGYNEIVSTELWLYNGDPSYGLPLRFNLLFFRENDIGSYQLYHPLADGPQALLHDGFSLRTNQNIALDHLEIISVDLAKAALTVDLSEPTSLMFEARNSRDPVMLRVRPSMAVDRNLADILEYPKKLIDTKYINKYLEHGNRVTTDYAFNYIDSRAVFTTFVGPENASFIHYAIDIDPENFTLETNETKTDFYTTLHATVELRSDDDQLLALIENEPFIRMTKSQFDQASTNPFSYRDSFPVIPGNYHVTVIIRNRATKQYSVSETKLSVSEPIVFVSISPLVLANRFTNVFKTGSGEHKTFQLGSLEIDPVTEAVYATNASLFIATQVRNANVGQRMRFTIFSDEKKVLFQDEPLINRNNGFTKAEFSIQSLAQGRYLVQGDLVDSAGNTVVSRQVPFNISPRTSIPRAGFVYRHSFPVEEIGLLDMTLGEQLMARGRLDEAELRLRRAVEARNPNLPMANWKLASVILFNKEADEALDLLRPLENSFGNQVEVVEGIGFAYYIKKNCRLALSYLEHAKRLRPADTSLLNALGDCYQQSGKTEKAKENFELSLQLNPLQEGVKARFVRLNETLQ